MNRRGLVIVVSLAVTTLSCYQYSGPGGALLGLEPEGAQAPATEQSPSGDGTIAVPQSGMRSVTPAQREAAALRAAAARQGTAGEQGGQSVGAVPGGTPDYFSTPNYANSPLPRVDPNTGTLVGGMRKFVDTLPGLGPAHANNLGQYIPIAIADTTTYPGSDYYRIGLVDYTERMHSDLPLTQLRGYKDLASEADPQAHYMGPLIVAHSGRPVRVKFTNMLGLGSAGNLFLPVDTSVMGAGMGPDPNHAAELYTQNRAVIHLHGGITSWISDGTPHQWITPAGETTTYPKGVSQQNVPDMPDPGPGSATHYYTNQQSSRLMFYHDHAYGMTRLNVYAGAAAGYLLTDGVEEALIDAGKLPNLGEEYRYGIPLIIQDKTFVDATTIAVQDPTWNWGTTPPTPHTGDLWFPHVYMPNQNPSDPAGINAMGRWDYGPWFWPPLTTASGLLHPPIPSATPGGPETPGLPNSSMVMEAFMDTPVVNGAAYPVLPVERKAYRFRILNACDDRTLNLQLYYVDPANPTEVKMVPAVPSALADVTWPATWPTDGRDGGVPDPAMVGPAMIQIGTEGGFLLAPVILPNTPIGYDYNRRSITVLNVLNHTLFLGPAERADVIVDFSGVPDGSKLILYNDSPAPVPALDPRYDYYTGDPDLTSTGGAPSTRAGYGPNTRTIMQFQVAGPSSPPFDLAELNRVWPAAYAASQPPPNVPEAAYGPAFGATFGDVYSAIADSSLSFNAFGSAAPTTIAMQPKAIQELFELDYGRMNATLGVELPLTNFNTQTTIPYGYIDPPTEILRNGVTQVWKVTHNGVDTHAIHFHLFNVQLINRVGWDGTVKPPDLNELGWKETVRMNPLEDAIVALTPVAPTLPFDIPESVRPLDPAMPLGSTMGFSGIDPNTGKPVPVANVVTNFGWEYVWHCHLLSHEEMDMMRPMVLTPETVPADTTPPTATAFVSSAPDANDVTVTIGAVDNLGGTGVASITYSASGATTRARTTVPGSAAGVVISSKAATTITYFATDNAGNEGPPQRITAPTASNAPITVTAVAGSGRATVSFVAPASGGSEITSYAVTSGPEGIGATGAESPITVTGLADGTTYTFTVTATNAIGTSQSSMPSNAVTPATLAGLPFLSGLCGFGVVEALLMTMLGLAFLRFGR